MHLSHKASDDNTHIYDAYKARYEEVYREPFKLTNDHIETMIQKRVASGHIDADNLSDVDMNVIEEMCEEGYKQ